MSQPIPAGDAGSYQPNTGLTDANNAKLQQLQQFDAGSLANMHGGSSVSSLLKRAAGSSGGGGCPFLALQSGVRYSDDDNSLKGGARGPTLLEDQVLREKINHFDHERIPERVVHARGTGAHGYFEVYESMSAITKAAVFADPAKKTPVFVRFSTVLGSKGAADTVRDVRGFAVKFYTEDGNWDLVGNNIPVFFIQDAMKFPDVIHAGKPEPQTEMPQGQSAHDNFWDFMSFSPESLHMQMWAMSDRAIPRSYRMMQGFGVHTFVFVNDKGVRTFFKAHWRPLLGVHGLAWDECLKLNGVDSDFHRRDLYDAIAAGNFPQWEFGVQLIAEEDENKFDFDILDSTKLVPEELVPIKWVGKMTLDRLPTDFFAEVEQVAFCTQNIVPGIDFSNDPLLAGRNFSYLDTQMTRLGGPNFNQIPINRPLHPPQNYQRDGFMQMNIPAQKLNYFPNRMSAQGKLPRPGNGGETQGHMNPQDPTAFSTYPAKVEGLKERFKAPKFLERTKQARLFFNSMSPIEQKHMLSSFSFELSKVDDLGVRQRVVAGINEVSHAFAVQVAANVGIAAPGKPKEENDGASSKFLSMITSPYSAFDSIATRKIAVIIADGYRASELAALKSALEKEGALLVPVGLRKGKHYSAEAGGAPPAEQQRADSDPTEDKPDPTGATVTAAFTLFNSKSVLFDGLALIGGDKCIATLAATGSALAFVCEAFKHCKAIAASSEAVKLLQFPTSLAGIQVSAAGGELVVEDGIVSLGAANGATDSKFTGAFISALKQHRAWDRKGVDAIPA